MNNLVVWKRLSGIKQEGKGTYASNRIVKTTDGLKAREADLQQPLTVCDQGKLLPLTVTANPPLALSSLIKGQTKMPSNPFGWKAKHNHQFLMQNCFYQSMKGPRPSSCHVQIQLLWLKSTYLTRSALSQQPISGNFLCLEPTVFSLLPHLSVKANPKSMDSLGHVLLRPIAGVPSCNTFSAMHTNHGKHTAYSYFKDIHLSHLHLSQTTAGKNSDFLLKIQLSFFLNPFLEMCSSKCYNKRT